MANVSVPLQLVGSAYLTRTNTVIDASYDNGGYNEFTVDQRDQEYIVTSGYEGSAVFVFEIPSNYIGFHTGTYYNVSLYITSGVRSNYRLVPCFTNPSEYFDAGCDHINKKVSYGKIAGTYIYDPTGSGGASGRYTTYKAYNTGWNLLDFCGAKYVALCITTVTPATIAEVSLSVDFNTDFPCSFIEPVYPKNVAIKKNTSQIFSWNVDGSKYNQERRNDIYVLDNVTQQINLVYSSFFTTTYWSSFTYKSENATQCPTYLKSHTLKYRKKGTSGYTSISETNDHNYVEIAANTFDIDAYEYYIEQTLESGYTIRTSLTDFNAIGQDAAPTITGVSNNSIPTVSWSDSNQAAFEVRIKNAEQNIVYTSGLLVGNAQSYQITKMLPNGTYIVEVRELNIYGIYSDWGSAQFTLNPSSVAAPTNIFVSVNNKYGVEISGTPAQSAQKTYVVRRIVGTDDIEIIGIYTGGIFTDYTAKGNTYYEYSLRNYNVAYADGAFTPVEVRVKEAVIQDGRDLTNFLDLSLSSNAIFNLVKTDEVDRTLYNCLGRKYPVKEMGEWINSVRTFTAYVRHEDLDRLSDINLNAPKVYYMGDHEYYACDLSIEDEGAYVGGGRLIQFVLTRIADDEGVVI